MSNKQSGCTYEKLKDCINVAFTNGPFSDCLTSANASVKTIDGQLCYPCHQKYLNGYLIYK